VAVAVLVAGLVSVPSASAEPKGIFRVFSQCPTDTPGIALCTYGVLTSGEFTIGAVKIPFQKALILQVGDVPTGNPENGKEYFEVPARNGDSLSKAGFDLPGDILGTRVTASPEMVVSEKNPGILDFVAFAREEGTGLTLPLRLHLNNPFLGGSCYIGSESNPLQLHMTDGETHPPAGFEPLHGIRGELGNTEENEELMVYVTGVSLVDNTFSVPGAEGCGRFDSLIDKKLEIPNRAGDNTAVLGGTLNLATASAAIASESWLVTPAFAPPVPGGLPASAVMQSTATLNGTLQTAQAPVDYHFQYGTTTSYGQIAPVPELYTPITSETLQVSQLIGGLYPDTTYHYRLVAGNPTGIRVVGPDETFTTLPAPASTTPGGTSGEQSTPPTALEHPASPTIQQPVVLHAGSAPAGRAIRTSARHAKQQRKRHTKHTKRRTRRKRRPRYRRPRTAPQLVATGHEQPQSGAVGAARGGRVW
jgi:hypothetical protein